MGKVIVIASGKGGTGKTTTAAALSSALAARKCRVLCIDADVGLRNMDLSLGLSEMALPDFCDVIEGRLSLEDAAFQHPTVLSLYFLSAPSLMSPEEIDPEKMRELLDSARRSFDYCIIDSPAGIGSGFRLAARFADSAIVVTTSDITSCRDVQRTVMELKALGIEDVSLIVNRIRPRLLKFSNQNIDDIVDTAGARLLVCPRGPLRHPLGKQGYSSYKLHFQGRRRGVFAHCRPASGRKNSCGRYKAHSIERVIPP